MCLFDITSSVLSADGFRFFAWQKRTKLLHFEKRLLFCNTQWLLLFIHIEKSLWVVESLKHNQIFIPIFFILLNSMKLCIRSFGHPLISTTCSFLPLLIMKCSTWITNRWLAFYGKKKVRSECEINVKDKSKEVKCGQGIRHDWTARNAAHASRIPLRQLEVRQGLWNYTATPAAIFRMKKISQIFCTSVDDQFALRFCDAWW